MLVEFFFDRIEPWRGCWRFLTISLVLFVNIAAVAVTFVRAAWSAGNNNYRSEGASVSNSNPLNVAPPDCACLDISGLNTGL